MRLRLTSEATTVQVRDGKVLISDGPFAVTKEQSGGYRLMDCKDLDEAIEVASLTPGARTRTIEVRPIWELHSSRGKSATRTLSRPWKSSVTMTSATASRSSGTLRDCGLSADWRQGRQPRGTTDKRLTCGNTGGPDGT